MAHVAYVRSSTAQQNNEYQLDALRECSIEKWFVEKKSGRTNDREQLNAMLDWVRDGDTVYCYDWSRLSRSLAGLLDIVNRLGDKGVSLVSIKEGTIDNTPTGRLTVSLLGAVNQYQVDVQREKQLAGIAEAKKKGVYKKRSALVDKDEWSELKGKWQTRQLSKAQFAKSLGVSRPTLDRILEREASGENIFKR